MADFQKAFVAYGSHDPETASLVLESVKLANAKSQAVIPQRGILKLFAKSLLVYGSFVNIQRKTGKKQARLKQQDTKT